MKLNAYVIHDKQADRHNQPILLENDAVAIRSIRNELMNPNSQISLSPEDFSIICIGYYDDKIGEIIPCEHLLVTEVKDIQLPEPK